MPAAGLIAKYRDMLQRLLPVGLAWTREPDATMTAFLEAQAAELARVEGRAVDLVDEADPRTAFELLPDWERVCGLPDECTDDDETLEQRRQAVVGRLVAVGGQSPEYFVMVAAQIGYRVTIDEFRPFRAGRSRAGDLLTNGAWIFAWRVNAPETTIRYFRAGRDSAGEPLRSWGNKKLECVIGRLSPSHTHVIFGYGG